MSVIMGLLVVGALQVLFWDLFRVGCTRGLGADTFDFCSDDIAEGRF